MKPSEQSERSGQSQGVLEYICNSNLLRFLLLVGCGFVIVQLIQFFYGVIAMFSSAAILAVLLNYPVRQLARVMPRGIAIAITIFSALGLIGTFLTILGLEIINQGQELLRTITNTLRDSDLPFENVLERLNFERVLEVLTSSLDTGLDLAGSIFSNTFTFIFVVVIAVYMLIDGDQMWQTVVRLIPVNIRDRFDRTVQEIFIGFFRAQMLLMMLLTVLSFIVYTVMGVQFALVLAIVVGILDAIPGIGATLGVLIVTVLVFASQGWQLALQVVIASVVLQQIQDNIIHPRVMKESLDISPLVMFLSLFIGEQVAGVLGLFLSIPISGVIVRWLKDSHDAALLNASESAAPASPQIRHNEGEQVEVN